jgi:hypothetical protein
MLNGLEEAQHDKPASKPVVDFFHCLLGIFGTRSHGVERNVKRKYGLVG